MILQNPWSSASFNLTQQMAIQKSDPKLAAKLRVEAAATTSPPARQKRGTRTQPERKPRPWSPDMVENDRVRAEHIARSRRGNLAKSAGDASDATQLRINKQTQRDGRVRFGS